MNPSPPAAEVRLPVALLNDFGWAAGLHEGRHVLLVVPTDYPQLSSAAPAASEVVGIQRLIYLARKVVISVTTRDVPCFEASIFDSGIGYFASYTRDPLQPQTDLKLEWQVLHNCLERHYFPQLADGRPGHRGMGLYEVLRALQVLKGRIEFRTGCPTRSGHPSMAIAAWGNDRYPAQSIS
jgi:hypothetical protein